MLITMWVSTILKLIIQALNTIKSSFNNLKN